MANIGIVGTGISGLHLALFLQHFGIGSTVYADRTPDQIREGRLPNTVARFDTIRARERELGLDHWNFDAEGWAMFSAYLWIKGDPPLSFRGDLTDPASFLDFRLYLPQLVEDYAARGGEVVLGPVSPEDLARLSRRHDLVVVATGAKALTELFPRDPAHSPFDAPQRRLMAGLFTGIEQADPPGLRYNVSPGISEIFQAPFYSFQGKIGNLLVEAVPGGPVEHLTTMRYEDDPKGFERAVLDVLREHATPVFEHVDPAQFALTRPLDLLQGAITPVVRRAWVPLDGDHRGARFAMAVGDTWVLNDPVLGQGANLGSQSAWLMAEAIRDADRFDEAFCRATEERMWQFAKPVAEWTNSALGPPPQHALELFAAAAQNQAVADDLVNGFADPRTQWPRFATPEGARAFLDQHGVPV